MHLQHSRAYKQTTECTFNVKFNIKFHFIYYITSPNQPGKKIIVLLWMQKAQKTITPV